MSQRPFRDPPSASDAAAGETAHSLPLETILQDWPGALARVSAYLGAIGFALADVRRLAKRAVERALGRPQQSGAVADAIDEAERLLLESKPLASDSARRGPARCVRALALRRVAGRDGARGRAARAAAVRGHAAALARSDGSVAVSRAPARRAAPPAPRGARARSRARAPGPPRAAPLACGLGQARPTAARAAVPARARA